MAIHANIYMHEYSHVLINVLAADLFLRAVRWLAIKKFPSRTRQPAIPLRKLYTRHIFVSLLMQLRNHVDTQTVKRFKR